MRMQRAMLTCVLVGATFGLQPANAIDVLLIHDDFDDGVLGSEWAPSYVKCFGWEYEEAGSALTVSDIEAASSPSTQALHAQVCLAQAFAPLADFAAEFAFSWDSDESDTAQQYLFLELRGPGGEHVAAGGYVDAWVLQRGSTSGTAGGKTFKSGSDTLPYAGSATVGITRTNGQIGVMWDGQPMVWGISTTLVAQAQVVFQYYSYDGVHGESTFGAESVDFVTISGQTDAPVEPSCPERLADADALIEQLEAENDALWRLIWLLLTILR